MSRGECPRLRQAPRSSEIGRSGRVWAYKEVPLKPKSTPQGPRDHESLETREHATSDITPRTMKPEKQRFWYEFYCGKWKPEKHESRINENIKKHPSILTQFLQVFSRFLWKSHRTRMTHESTLKSKQRFWYDFYCGEFQKWRFRTKFFHEMSWSIRRMYNFWIEKRVTTTKEPFAAPTKPPQSDDKLWRKLTFYLDRIQGSRLRGPNNNSYLETINSTTTTTTIILIKMTVCFSALALTLERRCIPQFLGGSSINVMVHPIPRHPALLRYEYYTCVEPRRLKVLTRCRIYPWRAVRSRRPS